MFEHLSQVSPAHRHAMATAIKAHNPDARLNPGLLGKLYVTALEGLSDRPGSYPDVFTSVLSGDHGKLSTATDKATGVFVQLSKVGTDPIPFLTVGQKWASESPNLHLPYRACGYW